MLQRSLSVAFLLSLPLCVYSSQLEFEESSVHSLGGLGNIKLFHDDIEGYKIKHNDTFRSISKHSVAPEIRNLTSKQLSAYQAAAFLTVREQSDGELSLKSHVRGEAGGPLLGAVVYWGTKAICYGVATAGVGTVVAAGTGLAPVATGVGVAIATAKASVGASVVSVAITGAGFATEAAVSTAMVGSALGSTTAAVAAIEGAAAYLGAWALLVPWI